MILPNFRLWGAPAFAVTTAAFACSSQVSTVAVPADSGTGDGASGTGGTSASGGTAGSGGTSATGGSAGGGSDASNDACVPETDQQFCSRIGKSCEVVTGIDNCGATRAPNCGTCSTGMGCVDNVCQ